MYLPYQVLIKFDHQRLKQTHINLQLRDSSISSPKYESYI